METVINLTTEKMDKAIEILGRKFANVRAGRANPNILEGIKVSYYGIDTPLIQLASILIPDAHTLSIKPFDKSALANIEKAIFEADLGFTPNNNGETITINIPPLTEERRIEYVKQAKLIVEEARIVLRNIRQESNNAIKKLNISEDEEKRGIDHIQDLINKYNKIIDEKYKEKETELMKL
ncbi:MAG: ribosome recycling factor [Bacilli bacterium]|jgi:ribosome recycling factor|nr:ribosome recycling factor [Bacilli bacterium]